MLLTSGISVELSGVVKHIPQDYEKKLNSNKGMMDSGIMPKLLYATRACLLAYDLVS
jgi:hypothetical protein